MATVANGANECVWGHGRRGTVYIVVYLRRSQSVESRAPPCGEFVDSIIVRCASPRTQYYFFRLWRRLRSTTLRVIHTCIGHLEVDCLIVINYLKCFKCKARKHNVVFPLNFAATKTMYDINLMYSAFASQFPISKSHEGFPECLGEDSYCLACKTVRILGLKCRKHFAQDIAPCRFRTTSLVLNEV